MKAAAPGKLLLSGAYAVLEGAPAIVFAVDRYAFAFGRANTNAPAEVRAALADPPQIDTSSLETDGRKLGLGSSAAALVAALALQATRDGEDVRASSTRSRLFARARAVHAEVQHGGSGVDVAASVYGGVVRYRTRGATDASIEPTTLPRGLRWVAFFSGHSARTSELRARVEALRSRDAAGYDRVMTPLARLAERADAACVAQNATELVAALQATGGALSDLGAAADAPIVRHAFALLAAEAAGERAAFIPSGAGGGDVGIFVGTQDASASFVSRAESLAMKRVELAIDGGGVVVLPGPTGS